MPPVPAVVGTVAKLGSSASDFTGTVPDWISVGFTIADHLKAQEGLKFNPHAFTLAAAADGQAIRKPSSARSRPQGGGKSAATAQGAGTEPIRLRLIADSPEILEIKSTDARVVFGLTAYLRDAPSGPLTQVYVLHLWDAKGFSSEVGDQAEVEFAGTEVEGGYLLSIKGFVNQWLQGFFHFSGDILVRQVSSSPSANAVVPLGYGRKVGTRGSISPTKHGFRVSF